MFPTSSSTAKEKKRIDRKKQQQTMIKRNVWYVYLSKQKFVQTIVWIDKRNLTLTLTLTETTAWSP